MTGGTGGPARSWAYWRGPVRLGLSIAGILVTVAIYRVGGWGFDFYAYWRAPGDDPYGVAWGFGAYHYTPALLPLFAPFRLLDFATAYWVWTILMVGVLVWLCRSWTLAALASPPVAAELFHGNVHLLFAATVVVGFRYPGVYAFGLLTKVTPGVGLVWFAGRRQWRQLAIATGVTAAIVAVSLIATPGLWLEWARTLLVWHDDVSPNQLAVPLLLRIPVAVALVAYAARTDRRWLAAVGVTLAIPVLWVHALSALVAVIPLARRNDAPSAVPARMAPVVPLPAPALPDRF